MSAKRNRSEWQANENYREALREVWGGEPIASGHEISAVPHVTAAEEGRVLIPRPDAGGATNDAPPAVWT